MAILDSDLDERVIAQNALTSATEHLKSLTSAHAPTFVAVECRENQLKSSLAALLSSLTENKSKVEDAQESLVLDKSNDSSNAATTLALLADRHRLRRRTLLQHSALLELLELPSLMDACVRSNDLYDEALSIAAFANTLERRHLATSQSAGVVENVVAEIRRRELDLKRQLLARLRGNVTMPQCLEVVTSLRRLNGVELERTGTSNKASAEELESVHAAMELRLQVDFFEARDTWLDSIPSSKISDVKIIGQSELLLESIERYRTRCFEIATQFLAIFRSTTFTSSSAHDADLSLLSLWTTRRIQIFLTSLSKQVSKIDDCASLRDSIDATLFFATSMGRIGADFHSLLPPIFEPQLVSIVISYWESGVEGLEKTLKVCREAGVASPLFAIMNQGNSDTQKEEEAVKNVDNKSSTPSPPRQLLTLPPLARFLNAYITGLNELRRCLLPGAFPALRQCFQDIMEDVRILLETNDKLVHTPGLKGEAPKLREVAKNMRKEYYACLEPYCRSSLDIAFGCFVEMEKLEKKVDDVAEVVEGHAKEGEGLGASVQQGDPEEEMATENEEEKYENNVDDAYETQDLNEDPNEEEQKEDGDKAHIDAGNGDDSIAEESNENFE